MLPCQSQSCPSISALGGAAGKNQEYGRWGVAASWNERARLLTETDNSDYPTLDLALSASRYSIQTT